jgi:hypothetical protein
VSRHEERTKSTDTAAVYLGHIRHLEDDLLGRLKHLPCDADQFSRLWSVDEFAAATN